MIMRRINSIELFVSMNAKRPVLLFQRYPMFNFPIDPM